MKKEVITTILSTLLGITLLISLIGIGYYATYTPDIDPSIEELITQNTVWVKYTWKGTDPNGTLLEGSAIGSGVLMTHDNGAYEVYTNRHVIDCGFVAECRTKINESIQVRTQDGTLHNITNTEVAPSKLDIAILTFNSQTTYEVVEMINSLGYDDAVVAVGYPAYTEGVSELSIATGRIKERKHTIQDSGIAFTSIESDAYTHFGSSGGGLFTLSGKLIGLSTWAGEGRSIAIATNSFPPRGSFIDCEEGTYAYGESSCAQYCEEQDVLSTTLTCASPCTDFYCGQEPPRTNTPDCPPGEVVDEDGICHPACGSNMFCEGNDVWCYQESCAKCDEGNRLYNDGRCY